MTARLALQAQRLRSNGALGHLEQIGLKALEEGLEHARLRKVVHELAVPFRADEAGRLKLLHVMRQSSGADGDAVSDGAAGRGRFLAAGDVLQDLVAARVGERAGDELNLILGKNDGCSARHER